MEPSDTSLYDLDKSAPAAQANRCTESAHPFNIQCKQSVSGLFNLS